MQPAASIRIFPELGGQVDYVEVWERGELARYGRFAEVTLVASAE